MEDDFRLPLIYGWRIDAWQLMKKKGYDFDQACDCVTLEYFTGGDARPFVDFFIWRWTPGSEVLKYLAAMIDPKFRTCPRNGTPLYEIRFQPIGREPKRPKRSESVTACDFHETLKADTSAMAEGRSPTKGFLGKLHGCLCYALDPEQFREIYKKDVRVSANLVRIDGRKGDKRDPELPIRDDFFGELVEKHIDNFGPGCYEAAIETVCKMMEDDVKNALEQAINRGEKVKIRYLSQLQKTKWKKTIKDAYDRRQRAIQSKGCP